MKILRSLLTVLAIGAVTLSTANASDSFSIGINVGGYGNDYYEPARYYSAPPVYYYEPVRSYYRAPIVSYQYYGGGHYNGGHHGYHHNSGHGWGNGYRGHNDGHRGRDGGHRRGHHGDDD